MSHDKIKTAARERVAQTGESYAAARAAVIKEHKAARRRQSIPDVSNLVGQIPDMSKLAGEMPDVAKLAGEMPDVAKLADEMPDVSKLDEAILAAVADSAVDQAILAATAADSAVDQAMKIAAEGSTGWTVGIRNSDDQ
jgi:hypothetical protein